MQIQDQAAVLDAANRSVAGARSNQAGILEFVTFAIGDDRYGVDIMSVREIKGWSGISPLAGQPEFVRGVLNLRGVMVPIVDLRCRFGQGMTEATATHIVIIVSIADQLVGLLADQVLDIVPYEASKIQPVPQVSRDSDINLFGGLLTDEDGMITLIDLSQLTHSSSGSAPQAA
ncbi:MAG: chemotaxis protein CheW [Pseudolabrys sp.]